ncbi:chlorophyll synthesis pathway protein BchC [Thermaurantiacus tibetensis]|uniref:chlorophyll synthesis pathway protein BchC n=2 Tax=Thermaurantiacus tibetensis TaxID=2759035 RepID=UPI002E2A757F|nr:chlorophyll synthesis pathway protein BchC [Thermaurantiacus tibetensis]
MQRPGRMETLAVVMERPRELTLRRLGLVAPTSSDLVVEIAWSGISTGTERLLWQGTMPPFPGLAYPLVPGYESVGRVVEAGAAVRDLLGRLVFVPGAVCYEGARGLFGGAARRLVVPAARVVPLPESVGEHGVLLALAATALHARGTGPLPDLIVGHGALGRLLARLAVLEGGRPTVWETNPARAAGARGYDVIHPDADARRDYARIVDMSGAPDLVDALVGRLARGGEIVLAGFYDRVAFAFPPAFMKEVRFSIAAEFAPADLARVAALVAEGVLALDGLITHRRAAADAPEAYETAFGDPDCIKMVLDWREAA